MTQDVDGQRHDRTALILYGSETGNSQEVAEELGRVAERLHFMTRVCEMDSVELNLLPQFSIVLFVTSTTGQGEFPKNAQKFWKSLLRKRLPPDCLRHVSFTTFGLGDSSYIQFNHAARKLQKRLEQLGAKEIYPRGEADERHDEGTDGTFLSWSADFRKHLLSTFPLPEGVAPIPSDTLLPPKILLGLRKDPSTDKSSQKSITSPSIEANLVAPSSAQDIHLDPASHAVAKPPLPSLDITSQDPKMLYEPAEDEHAKAPLSESPPCPMLKEEYKEEPEVVDLRLPPTNMLPLPDSHNVKLKEIKRITPDTHWQDVRLLTFYLGYEFDYFVGDTITIYPKNFPTDVQALIDLMGWNDVADIELTFNNTVVRNYGAKMAMNNVPEGFVPLPNSTLRDLITHNLDITAIPNRYFFELAANHTDDPVHKLRLQEFSSAAYTDEYYDYATRPRRSILEVLHDFPTVKIPFEWALAAFPAIRGRAYSICSAAAAGAREDDRYLKIEILVAMVKYKTVLKKVRQGLCSRYLASLQPGTWICSKLSETKPYNSWTLNSENKDHLRYPIICVAPGTGVAPCRALIWSRAILEHDRRTRYSDKLDRAVGHAYLFFGGRNKKNDFFFENEYKEDNMLATVFTAFSRDQKEKRYVQDVLKEQGSLVADLIIKQHARIFVCGSSGNMPKSVRAAFLEILEKWDREERPAGFAEALLADMVKFKRYTQETW